MKSIGRIVLLSVFASLAVAGAKVAITADDSSVPPSAITWGGGTVQEAALTWGSRA